MNNTPFFFLLLVLLLRMLFYDYIYHTLWLMNLTNVNIVKENVPLFVNEVKH
jgi:hypothetical protein